MGGRGGIGALAAAFLVAAGILTPSTAGAKAAAATWAVVASPSPGNVIVALEGVSCVSATDCVAVGDNWSSVEQTLVESWDGTSWTVVPSPNQGTSDNNLNAVSCTSASNCVAVGHWNSGPTGDVISQTLIETWDGTNWTIVTSPNIGTVANLLTSVSCTGPSTCVAVGSYYSSSNQFAQTLIEVWDGVNWTIDSSPSNTGVAESLNGVSCLSSTDSTRCLAVGNADSDALAETWDGTTWTLAPVPAGYSVPPLGGVSCISGTSDCVAVGTYHGGVWTETWDGTIWSGQVGVPVHKDTSIGRIACVSLTSCTVVGSYATSTKKQSPPTRTIIDQLKVTKKATMWAKTKSPSPGKMFNGLDDVTCLSTTDCVAVGSQDTATADGTLVLMSSG
jgi:hypothetical protein